MTPNDLEPEDIAGFLAAIDETPGDDSVRLILADWLEEQLNDPAADGLRVAVKRGWRPYRLIFPSIEGPFFVWRRQRRRNFFARTINTECRLPHWLFRLLPGRIVGEDDRDFSTVSEAWWGFMLAWREAVRTGQWPRSLVRKKVMA